MNVLMDTGNVSPELRMYLPLYTEVLLESPVLRDGSEYLKAMSIPGRGMEGGGR